MTIDEIKEIKKHIFVYHIIPFDSIGIYIAEDKEAAIKFINEDLWDNVDYDKFQNPPEDIRRECIKEIFGDDLPSEIVEKMIKEPRKPISVADSVEIWTWEEYQEIQGFDYFLRLLEICK